MVLRYKNLMQPGAAFTRLCSSRTNGHDCDVWTHSVKLVSTSDRWRRELRELPREARDWLLQSSVYVHVHRPLRLRRHVSLSPHESLGGLDMVSMGLQESVTLLVCTSLSGG